jgi:serine/threonine protein kinase
MSTQQPLRLTDFASFDVTVERTASGGFGVVFMGPDRLHNGQWFALKTLRPELLRIAPRARDLIVREGLTWIGLWPHAYVLIANTVTQINTQPFLVLNYAAGGSLRDLMATFPGGLLPQRTGLRLAQHIAAGLDALHTAAPEFLRPEPLVHRDLKPENVLMHESGLAEITDFGLAKVVAVVAEDDPRVLPAIGGEGDTTRSRRYQTRKGAALGTIQYMAPEQWEDAASAEPPADMYAFGLMLSELLASRHALLDLAGGCGEAEWRAAHAQPAPRRLRAVVPELPMALEELFHACLTARPEQRPTAREALSVLQRTAETLGQDAYIPAEVVPPHACQ